MKSRFSIVITRMDARHRLPQLPWLEERYGIDEGEWIVLTHESWLALADGEAGITGDLERKLLMTFYVHQPDVIVVVGYPAGKDHNALAEQTRRIMRRVDACLLPTEVLGFVVNAHGEPEPVGIEAPVNANGWIETDEPSPLVGSAAE